MCRVNALRERKTVTCLVLLLACSFIAAGPSEAVRQVKANDVKVPAGEIIDGPLLAAGKDVYVDGTVDGDLYVFGSNVIINGTVKGDLLTIAGNLEVNGVVDGDFRALCGTANIDGEVKGNVSSLSRKVVLTPQGVIERGLLMGVMQAKLQGAVKDQVCGWGGDIKLGGEIGSAVTFFNVGQLIVDAPAKIKGVVRYSGTKEATVSPRAAVAGDIQWDKKKPETGSLSIKIVWFIAGLLVWYVLNLLFPGYWSKVILPALNRPFAAMSWGVAVFLVVPFLMLALFLTVVGLPLALMVSGFYIAMIYMGKITLGHTLGHVLARRLKWENRVKPLIWFLVGYGGIFLLGSLPLVDLTVGIFAPCWTLGVIFLAVMNKRRQILLN